MTDSTPPAPNGDTPNGSTETPVQPGQPALPGFRIMAQYVRDFSFENPRAPESLKIEGRPNIDLGVEMNAQGRQDGLFEVDLKLSVKATSEGKPVFQVELVYGGLFQLMNVAEKDIEPLLLIECPRYLFPFARETIAKATADGGFYPPFLMEPIDFGAIFAQRQAQVAQGASTPPGQA
ncbi:protein-export chaperone SecB [Brevundimonas sp.]|uniref:protein-export chaperone SecB n=1 Tax=Brevundimonas sp. TaxID=1871086 RepID=UPI003AF8FA36